MYLASVVLNWNNANLTMEAIRSLQEQTYEHMDIYLMDNGSNTDDREELEAFAACEADVQFIAYDSNLGFTEAHNRFFNRIIKAGKYDYVALLNNDACADPNWVSALIQCAQETGASMVASKMVQYHHREKMDNAGHVLLNTGEVLPRGHGEEVGKYDKRAETFGCCAGACLYELSMLEDIGLFDDYFHTGYEDAELGIRGVLAGYACVYEPRALVYHRAGATINKIKDEAYLTRIQTNIFYSYLKCMPTGVILLNAPFIAFKYLCILIIDLILFRWRQLHMQWRAWITVLFKERAAWLQYRSRNKVFVVKRGIRDILKRMNFFLWTDVRRFRDLIIRGEQSYFDLDKG